MREKSITFACIFQQAEICHQAQKLIQHFRIQTFSKYLLSFFSRPPEDFLPFKDFCDSCLYQLKIINAYASDPTLKSTLRLTGKTFC